MLAKRLARRGLVLSGGALAVVLARGAATACGPPGVVYATVKAASLFAAGKAAVPGAVSAPVAALTEGVLKAMLMTKIKVALSLGIVVGLLLMASALGFRAMAADKAPAAKSDNNRLRDTILVLDKMWWEAAAKHDVDTLDKLMADNFVGVRGTAVAWNKANMLEQHRQFRNYDMKALSEREVFRINEHTAVLTYETKFSTMTKAGAPAGSAHWRLTSCWVQRDGGWFVAFWQGIDLPDPTPAPAKVDKKPWEGIVIDPVGPVEWGRLLPEIQIEPKTFRPSLIAPVPPGAIIEYTGPFRFEPIDPAKFHELMIPMATKPAAEPKGTG
jgi:hypothetical protein